MKINFMEWIQHQPQPEQIPDVLAQLLDYSRENYGVINPNCFSVEFPDDEDSPLFPTLLVEAKATQFDEKIAPVKVMNDESDDIFVIGLLLYQMLGYELPNLKRAKLMLAQAVEHQQVPLLSVKNSSLNPLLEQMTDMNVNTRISREEALNWLAEQFPSNAIVLMLEQETRVQFEKLFIPLRSGVTSWKPPAMVEYNGCQFFPETSAEYRFPYRLKPLEYPCFVRAKRQTIPNIEIRPESGKLCFGLDFGTYRTRISRLDENGTLVQLPEIPSVIAYRNQHDYVCGTEAMQLYENQNADFVHCFDIFSESEKGFSLMASDGSMIQETRESVMLKFLKYIHYRMENHFQYQKDISKVVMTIPSSSPVKFRDTLQKCMEKVGFSVALISSAMANIIFHGMREPLQGNVMVIDVGESVTDVCMVHSDAQDHCSHEIPEYAKNWHSGKGAKAGNAMSETLYQSILQTLNTQYALNFYQQEQSNLNATQFLENVRKIRKEADRMKHTLSFSEKAVSRFDLYADHFHQKTVEIGFTKSQYQNLLFPILQETENAIRQILSMENITVSEVDTVLVVGGASLTPAIHEMIQNFFSQTNCKITYCNDEFSVAYGAVLFAGIFSNIAQSTAKLTEFPDDLGIITADTIYHSPVFQPLVSAGTEFENDVIHFQYHLLITENDLDEEKHCVLRLYRRPKGMESVRNTLEPDGENIRCIGHIVILLPEKYVMKSDKLVCDMTIDIHEKISVTVSHYRDVSRRPIMKLLKKVTNDNKESWNLLETEVSAQYFPLS